MICSPTFQILFNLQQLPMTPNTSCLQLENFSRVPVQSVGPSIRERRTGRGLWLFKKQHLIEIDKWI